MIDPCGLSTGAGATALGRSVQPEGIWLKVILRRKILRNHQLTFCICSK